MNQEEIGIPPLQTNDINAQKMLDRDNPSVSNEDTRVLSSLATHAETESAIEANNGIDITLSQVHAKTMELHKFCSSMLARYQQRFEKIEQNVQGIKETPETLLNQIADLETRFQHTTETMEARVLQAIS